MKVKKIPAILIAACCVALVLVFVLVNFMPKKNNSFAGGRPAATNNVTSVKTMQAQVQTLHDYVNTNGEIEPQSSIEVYPSIGGKIFKVYVSLGSQVERNQIIAEVDPSEPGVQYSHSPVYAPIAGTITANPSKQGEKVTVSSVITTIGDVDNLQLTASIPERYVSSLKIGLSAEVVLEAYPDVIFYATVVRVSPVVDATSRTKEIILNFDKKDSRINAGMFAKVKLYTEDYSGAIVIPSSAIIDKNGDDCVYVVKDSKASLRQVKTGNSVDTMIQILDGVEEGESIVVEGMRALSDGATVRDITNAAASSNTETAEEK